LRGIFFIAFEDLYHRKNRSIEIADLSVRYYSFVKNIRVRSVGMTTNESA